MDFKLFKAATAKQFERMSQHQLFRVDVDKDLLWSTYLSSFPQGSNPIYKERTHHDCNCCKQFIRAVGNVVAVIDGRLESIWNCTVAEPNYQAVTDEMAILVTGSRINNVFVHFEPVAGTSQNFQDTVDGVKTWNHFFVNIPKKFVMPGADIGSHLGKARSTRDVFERSLRELTLDSIDTVLELISQNTLYRGAEQKFAVEKFREQKTAYELKSLSDRAAFVWCVFTALPESVSRIRNTSIGTLLVELSEGIDMDRAVASFESKVAPANYKRPTALVTKSMIEAAKKTIEEQGLTSALERRYATFADITINNLLFADRSTRKKLNADVFDALVEAAGVKKVKKTLDKVETVTIDKFISDILPKAESIEVMVENKHAGNFVSLIAPVDPTSKNMFKWDNRFSWSYNGEMADSIKERVKKAGGSVEGVLCCRLAWDYTDDLDFHMHEPNKGHIYFGTRGYASPLGGKLDVDANGGSGMMKEPVENIFYANKSRMVDGVYTLSVHNYNRRSDGVGFEVEVDVEGSTHTFVHEKVLRSTDRITVADISLKDGAFSIKSSLPTTTRSKVMWTVPTQEFRRVSAVMMSPNYWDDLKVGNKHFFFMLDGCANDGQARGFFNEFLKEDLNAHRKVIEMVGSKMKTELSTEQLSGLGFSSTSRASLKCRVKGAFSRVIEITF